MADKEHLAELNRIRVHRHYEYDKDFITYNRLIKQDRS